MSDTVHILLVEDHPADIALTRKAFGRVSTPNRLHVVLDGRECMAFLQKTGRYPDAPRPDLILLDLNMPRMGGLEVLEAIDKSPDLWTIPVTILTTSAFPPDVQKAYALRVNSYVVKPVKYSDFLSLIQSLESYWFRVSELPPNGSPP
jgi:CheY-like chemotaxis protein